MTKKSIDDRVNRLFLELNQGMELPIGLSPPVNPATEDIENQARPANSNSNPEDDDKSCQISSLGVNAKAGNEDFEGQATLVVPPPKNKNPICPFLKAHWDDTITYGFPNEENFCYRPQKAQAVSLIQQEIICLSGQFQSCPVYIQIKVEDRLPIEIRPKNPVGKWKTILKFSIPPILILFLVAAMLMIYLK